MSASLILASLWVILAAVVAMLPMRFQYAPGVTLLAVSPFLIGYLGYQHNLLLVGVGVFAVLSMFRRPLGYLVGKTLRRKDKSP